MKKFSLFLLILFISIPVWSQTIKIGYFQSAPYVFQDTDSKVIKGATYDFLEQKIAPEMGVKFEWAPNPIPIPRQLEDLVSGKLDASAMFAKNPERAKKFVYPDKPYLVSHPILVVKNQYRLKQVNSIDDVLGITIGFCTKSYISPFMRDQRIKWDLMASSNCIAQNLKKLIAGRFEAQYQPSEPALLFYARESGVENQIRLVKLPEDVGLYVPFSKQAAAKYIDSFNKSLEKAGGIEGYKTFLAKYIDITKM